MKRVLDIMASVCGLLVLAPFFMLIAVAIKLDSPGPVFFRQERVGVKGHRFSIFKFRTMVNNLSHRGRRFTVRGDARVTRVGRWLRNTKIDELPQLLNVLRGEMALVGPRPEVPEYVELFWEEFEPVLQVRPGITHQASIAFRNEEELLSTAADPERFYLETIMPRKLAIYTETMEDASIARDVRTILDTVLCVALQVSPREDMPSQEMARALEATARSPRPSNLTKAALRFHPHKMERRPEPAIGIHR